MGADVKALPMGSFAALTADPSCLDGLTNGERLVVHEIQRRVGGDLSCFPSQGRIAKDSGLSRRWVNRILGDLESKGYIRSRPGEGRRSKTYELVPEKFGLAVSSQPQPVETTDPAEAAENVLAPKEPRQAKGFYPAPRQAQGGSADYAEVLRRLSGIEQAVALLTQMVAALSEHRYSTRMRGMGGDLIQTEFVFHEVSEADFLNPPIPAEWNDVPEGVKPAWSAEDCETFTMDIPCPFSSAAPSEASKAGNKAGKPEQLFLLPAEGGSTSEPAPKPETKPAQKTEQKPAWDEEDGWRRFWAVYPNHREEDEARRNFHTRFARLAQPEAMLQRMLGVIGQMRRTDLWTKEDGKYVHLAKNFLGRNKKFETLEAGLKKGDYDMVEDDEDEDAGYDPSRPVYLQRSPATDAELVTGMETGRSAYPPAAPRPVRQWTKLHWRLCSERCKNYDPEKGCCRCGVKTPPEYDRSHDGGMPPEDCKHFERIDGQEPTPRTLDALMNESLRPAARTGVRGVKPLASVFGGVLSSMESQT